ncbi:MAG: M1 family peptidase, partial [Bacteroidetes bacterium]|nr:M1 family peptidase [Bacteroidota bacterium]
MRRIILFLSLFFIHNISIAQKKYWQQRTDYNIDVVLDTATSSIDGTIQINYVNNSPDTLKFIWFHLWPNAYKNDRTAFSEQFLENGNLDFYFSSEEKKGYINKVNFTSNGVQAPLLQDSIYGDIFKLILP